MTTHIDEKPAIQIQATEDFSGAHYKAATLGGTICQAASIKQVAGIIKTAPGSGYNAQIVYAGITKAFFGAGVSTVGYPVKVANSGWIIPCNSGDMSIGRSLTTANSGDVSGLMLDVRNLGFFGG
jgi:hypothetical protein